MTTMNHSEETKDMNEQDMEIEVQGEVREEAVEETEAACDNQATDDTAEDGKLKFGDRKKLKRAEADLAAARKELEAKDQALAEEKDRYMRMMAEYDNFRRRTAKEKDGIYADAIADAVKELLPVIDNLERAAAATPEGGQDGLSQGVQLTLKSAMDTLNKLGVSVIETETFDPNVHNAVMHVDDEAFGEGQIVEVFQKGYIRGDKVIRFALVKVAN